MIIDAHTHIVPPEMKLDREKYFSDPLFRLLYDSRKAKLATAEDLIESMDRDGIDFSLVLNIGWSSSELCTYTNNYIREATERYPKRLAGFGTVFPGEPEKATKEIDRCSAIGLRGIGEMRLDRQLISPENHHRLEELIGPIIKHNMILLLHCSEPIGHQYSGKGDTTPDIIYQLVQRFPDLSLICAHWGGGLPFYTLMPEVKKSVSKILFDTAASPFIYSAEIYQQVIALTGAGSILFGTDYPLLSQARPLREVRSLQLPADAEERILSLNARKLLGINI
jgi:uncharacterized protein